MADARDINRPGGWYVRVTTPGPTPIVRFFKVYELDQGRAIDMVRAFSHAAAGETVEAVSQLNVHEFTGDGMQPGAIKQHG